jgi:hypothetical protein
MKIKFGFAFAARAAVAAKSRHGARTQAWSRWAIVAAVQVLIRAAS